MPPKCPNCSCENCELDPVYVTLRANGNWTPFKCRHCTCSSKPEH